MASITYAVFTPINSLQFALVVYRASVYPQSLSKLASYLATWVESDDVDHTVSASDGVDVFQDNQPVLHKAKAANFDAIF